MSDDIARAALRDSMETNREQTALTEESRLLLQSIVRSEIRDAVAEGIKAAMTDDAAELFWNKGIEVLHRQAKLRAGTFLLDGFLAAGKKAFWICVFLAAVYWFGGWTMVKTMWVALFKG
jgi:hypothetical protein